ncbi:MICOS complex subunit Mic60-like [Pectinophora gossypiella]|uniref:MICOS complex subunit Mic60-like n=1 Tax=Pectinophora gossypiella TaxID=13191 RepID=UPI00214F3345|nr:MICOS complex subunit Mic60-like [Pectinophora gossypiella]
MFRISPYMIRTSTILLRRSPVELQVVQLSRSTVHNQYKKPKDKPRDPCPKPPKPCPPPKNDFYFWGTVAFLMLTGSFAVYAKNNPEVRDWLSINMSWFDDIIAVIYQENYPIMENAVFFGARVKKYLLSLMEEGPRECSLEGPGLAITDSASTAEADEGEGGDDDDEDDEDDEDEDDLTEEDSPCDVLPPPVITKDICELEECLKDLGDSIINNYLTARDACIYYNKLVKSNMSKFCVKSLKKLRAEMEDRKDLVKKSLNNTTDPIAQLKDLTRYIECGCQASEERLQITRDMLQDYQDRIQRMRIEYEQENQKSTAVDQQWQIVESLLEVYMSQTTSMYPELDYYSNTPEITGDADFLLITSKKYVEYLRPIVKASDAAMTERVNRAVALIDLPPKERDQKVMAEFKKALGELDREYNSMYAELRADHDAELKEQLRKQRERHESALARMLEIKERETTIKLKKKVEEAVAAQKKIFDMQLREMQQRLMIVEAKLNERLKAERESKRAQLLYAAGSSLLRATRKANRYVNVERELMTLAENTGEADGDKLVRTVLESIPEDVWGHGVTPESTLRKNYKSMEGVAMSVSMVEKEGSALPVYAFSWLQSMFLFMRLSTIPQAELDNPVESFEHLDTFDLLQRARYFVEKGNMAKAVRYVDALEGASRGAAEAWYNDARAHVQTRQAAEAILAHAARLCLQYI